MKKSILLFLVVIISVSVYSQDYESGDLKNKFYIRVGYSTPLWTYYGFKNANALKSELNAKSKIGANFEIGKIYMLNGINIGPGLRFGINADFLSLKAQVFNLNGGDNIYNLFVGSKIGPSFTYSPAKALAFDIFAKINPVWVGGVYYNQQDISDGSIEAHLGYVQMMYSFGINVRVSILMLGFEYEIGSLKLKNGNGDYWNPANTVGDKVSMPGFNLTAGLNF